MSVFEDRELNLRWTLVLSRDLAPLLPTFVVMPREEVGEILLGADKEGRSVYLSFKLPNLHGIILGAPGVGKTALAMKLLLDFASWGVISVVIDPHGEYEPLIRKLGGDVIDMQRNVLDILATKHDTKRWASELAESAASAFGLSDFEKTLAEYAFEEAVKAHDVRRFFDVVEEELGKGNPIASTLLSKVDVLHTLVEPNFNVIAELERRKRPLSLVFNVGGRFMHEGLARFLACVLVGQLASLGASLGRRPKPDYICWVDEAHRYIGPAHTDNSPLVRAYRELRKFGVAFVVITHSALDIPDKLYELAGFKIFLSGDPEYIRGIEAVRALTKEEREWLGYGAKGQGLVYRLGEMRSRRVVFSVPEEVLAILGG